MDRHPHAGLLGHRHDLAQEGDEVGAKAVRRHVAIDIERAAETVAVEDELARRHPADKVLLQPRQFALAHRREPLARRLDAVRRMFGLGVAPLQHQHVIGAEIHHVEAHRRAAVPHGIIQIGAGPVGDRHEIVADRRDAGSGDGADRRLVVVDQLAEAAGTGLDVLVHDDALDDRPFEPAGLDFGLALQDLVKRPGAAVIEMVKRGDHAGRAGLPRMRRALPGSSGPNQRHVCFIFAPSLAASAMAARAPLSRMISR